MAEKHKDPEETRWEFECSLTVAGWVEKPELSDSLGTMYEKKDIRLYVDEIGVFVYRKLHLGWVRLFGQSYDEMLSLPLNTLTIVLTLDLLSGEMVQT